MQLNSSRKGVTISTAVVNKTTNIRTSIIRMIVSSTDNAKNITCTAISRSSPPTIDSSDPALLFVQGILHVVF